MAQAEMQAQSKITGLIDRLKKDPSQDALNSISKEVEDLRENNTRDLSEYKKELNVKQCEEKQTTKTLKENERVIEKLKEEIEKIENVIKKLDAQAKEFDNNATDLAKKADNRSLIGWGAVAVGLSGAILAPFSGGLSLVVAAAAVPGGAGVAGVAFLTASDARKDAAKNRKMAKEKRSEVDDKRHDVRTRQNDIDKDKKKRNILIKAIHKLQKDIGYLEAMSSNLSTLEALVCSKMEPSNKPSDRASKMNVPSSTKDVEIDILDAVTKERAALDKIIINLNEIHSSGSSDKPNLEYMSKTLPWAIRRMTKLRSIVMDVRNQELSTFLEVLKSTRNDIGKMKGTISSHMLSGIQNMTTEQSVLKRLDNEVQEFEEDISKMESKIQELEKTSRDLTDEANELEKLAAKKHQQMKEKRARGLTSIGLLAGSAVLAPFTAGASLSLIGVSGAFAGYNLVSACDCEEEAKQKTEQAEHIRNEIKEIKWKKKNTYRDKKTRENQMKQAKTIMGDLQNDIETLTRILGQLMESEGVINRILAELQIAE